MFKVDQFSAANEAALNQFAHFAQLSMRTHEGEVFLTRLTIVFSCFAKLVTVYGDEETLKSLQ